VRNLHAPAAVIGGVLAVGGCGGILGGVLAGRINRRLGSGRAVLAAAALGGPCALLAPLGTPLLGPWSVGAGVFGGSVTSAVYNAGVLSHRQGSTPRELLSRVASAVRMVTSTALPVGALVGGALATGVGPCTTMIVAAVGYAAAACWLLPLRNQRELPDGEPPLTVAAR
jgi:predicted MFS family arabinose efflux permease